MAHVDFFSRNPIDVDHSIILTLHLIQNSRRNENIHNIYINFTSLYFLNFISYKLCMSRKAYGKSL